MLAPYIKDNVIIKRRRLTLYANNKKTSDFKKFDAKNPMVIEPSETYKDKILLKNPLEIFLFLSFMSIWFGGHLRKKMYHLLNKR